MIQLAQGQRERRTWQQITESSVDNVELKLWALEERESVQRGLRQQLRRTLDVFSMCNVKVYSEGESSCSWLDSRPCKPGLSREAQHAHAALQASDQMNADVCLPGPKESPGILGVLTTEDFTDC